MTVDFLIIGQGLAGSLLAWELLQRGCKVLIVDNNQENASQIAAGLINPVTGMRLVKASEIDTLLPVATRCYAELTEYFQQPFYIEKPMLRILRSQNEASYLKQRLADRNYQDYLTAIEPSGSFLSSFGLVQQKHTGYLLTQPLLTCLKSFFIAKNCYRTAVIDYADIKLGTMQNWLNITAKQIVFCEGHQATQNPWFSWLPFKPVKGEILTLSHPTTLPENILNNGHWLIPTAEQQIRVGATFDRDNLNTLPTEQGKNELLAAARTLTSETSIDVIDHKANIRPCTADRKPFIGRHPEYPQLIIFNGFGAKGSLQIPWHSQQLAEHLLASHALPHSCDIKRHENTHYAG
ncbi:MAG: FAD-binding oxidoreductase [Methylococcaceae bacterium]|nr:FAD-binding oxidoreductase [Methylococcaceae bacterium]MDP2394254.1 FAD-binding oxidoreductase [Methylococcaceae bacterium]MDP3020082.1 FAD-binding oxidoreductase [Methylococcaceae bacterium]MDP3388824.1 FAD-binding oxidoreductase [Methylococcaceae bacterium]